MPTELERATKMVKDFAVKALTTDGVAPEHLVSALLEMAAVVAKSSDLTDELVDQLYTMTEVFDP